MKATEQYFTVVLFIMLYKMVRTFQTGHGSMRAKIANCVSYKELFNARYDFSTDPRHILS